MSSNRSYFTYMMASPSRIIYTGMTGDLGILVWQHKNNLSRGFVRRYGCKKLVWFGETSEVQEALREEKRLKRWHRQWKINLIERDHPQWRDLASEWGSADPETSSG